MSLRDIDFTRDSIFAGDEDFSLLRDVEARYRYRVYPQPLNRMFGTWIRDLDMSLAPDLDEVEPTEEDWQTIDEYGALFHDVHPLVEDYDPYSLYMMNYYNVCDRCGTSLNWLTDEEGSGTLCTDCLKEVFVFASETPIEEL